MEKFPNISGGCMSAKLAKPEIISVSEFRRNLPNIIARIQFLGESFVISKHDKNMVYIGSPKKETPKKKVRGKSHTSER